MILISSPILIFLSFITIFNSFNISSNGVKLDVVVPTNILITDYNMDLKLGYRLKNDVNITIKNTSDNVLKEISLLLDDAFIVDTVKTHKQNLVFLHEQNILKIKFSNDLNLEDSIDLNIKYKGQANFVNDVDNQYTIATKSKVMLPYDSLVWYPTTKQNEKYNITLNTNINSEIYSNLSMDTKTNILTGYSNKLFLISNNLNSTTVNGYTINYPYDTDSKSLNNYLSYLISDINNLKLSEDQLQEIEDKKEIIIAPIFNSTQQLIQVVDGVIVIAAL